MLVTNRENGINHAFPIRWRTCVMWQFLLLCHTVTGNIFRTRFSFDGETSLERGVFYSYFWVVIGGARRPEMMSYTTMLMALFISSRNWKKKLRENLLIIITYRGRFVQYFFPCFLNGRQTWRKPIRLSILNGKKGETAMFDRHDNRIANHPFINMKREDGAYSPVFFNVY